MRPSPAAEDLLQRHSLCLTAEASIEVTSLWLQVDHDDKAHQALNAFSSLWKEKFASDSLLVFSTGRSHALYEELRVRTLCSKTYIYYGLHVRRSSEVAKMMTRRPA